MRKLIILTIAAACLWLGAFAQGENLPVMLVAAQGKPPVYQSPAGGSKSKLVAGAALQHQGRLQLKKRSSAVLFYNGEFQRVEGKKAFSPAELFPESNEGLVRLNFEFAFVNYLSAAVNLAADPANAGDAWGGVKNTSGTGDGWGGIKTASGTGDGWGGVKQEQGTGDGWGGVKQEQGTGDGWGGRGKDITAILPFGKVLPGVAAFSWSRPAGVEAYRVVILDMDGNTVAEKTVRDTACTFDLAQPPFSAGTVYQWRVSPAGDEAAASNTRLFELGDAAVLAEAAARAERSSLYQEAPESLRALMRAVALERNEWYLAAAEAYRDAQKAEPQSEMARLMQAAFWLRQGLKGIARHHFRSTKMS